MGLQHFGSVVAVGAAGICVATFRCIICARLSCIDGVRNGETAPRSAISISRASNGSSSSGSQVRLAELCIAACKVGFAGCATLCSTPRYVSAGQSAGHGTGASFADSLAPALRCAKRGALSASAARHSASSSRTSNNFSRNSVCDHDCGRGARNKKRKMG